MIFSAILKKPKVNFLLEAMLSLRKNGFEHTLSFLLMQMCSR